MATLKICAWSMTMTHLWNEIQIQSIAIAETVTGLAERHNVRVNNFHGCKLQ